MAEIKARRQNAGQDIDALVKVVNQLVTLANELRTDVNALLAKLDADAGVTDANYVTTAGISSAAADSITLSY